jgi:hypothetical protein
MPDALTSRQRQILDLMDAEHQSTLSKPFVKALRRRGLYLRMIRMPRVDWRGAKPKPLGVSDKAYWIPMPQDEGTTP